MKQKETSVTSTGRCGGPFVRNRRVCSHTAKHRTKRTCKLHQRGNGTLRNGHDSKLRATHVEGSVGVDLAGLDSHVSSIDGNPAALKRTTWSRQRGAWLPNKATSAGRCGGPFVRNRRVCSHTAKQNKTHTSVTSTGPWNVT